MKNRYQIENWALNEWAKRKRIGTFREHDSRHRTHNIHQFCWKCVRTKKPISSDRRNEKRDTKWKRKKKNLIISPIESDDITLFPFIFFLRRHTHIHQEPRRPLKHWIWTPMYTYHFVRLVLMLNLSGLLLSWTDIQFVCIYL